MNTVELYNFLINQIGFKDINKHIADNIAGYIPNIEAAKLIFEKNNNTIDYFNDIPSVAKFIQSFLKTLISDRKVEYVLDPWANIGEILYLTGEVFPMAQKTGFVMNKRLYEFNKIVKANFNQQLGNPLELLSEDNTKYDLIISNLPVGLAGNSSLHGLAKTDISLQIIIESLSSLAENGLLISIVNSSFFGSSNANNFKSVLIEKGFHLKALFGTPIKAINQNASIPFYLIVIEKGLQSTVFLAEVNENKEEQKRIFDNYKRNRNSKNISEGYLTSINEIAPIQKYLESRELELLLRRTGLPLKPLHQLGKFKKLSEVENEWLIISKNPNKKIEVGLSKDELNDKFNFFFQIDTQVIDPIYLLELLNSTLGNKILNSVTSGLVLPLINIKDLQEILLPVDSLASQKAIIELDRKIKNYEEEFSSLRINLWKNPKHINETVRIINQKLTDPDSVEWMEQLPFPLSSILWGYHSESRINKKVEYMFLFYEGLCEFIDILLLSGLVSNKVFYNNTVTQWLMNEQIQDWHIKSSFGGWRNLHEKLSKNVRTLCNINSDTKKFIHSLFCGASEEYLNILISKELVTCFSDVNKLRNDYKGHGGITSDDQQKEILDILESKFFKIKENLSAGFRNVKLISPLRNTMDWDEETQMFSSTCRLLKGTRTKFNQIDILTNKQLSSKKLYLLHENQFSPLEVLPLVQMRETPKTEQNACYFYNRIEGNKVRLVSYHFDKEAELFDPIEPIIDVFKILNPFV